MNDRIFILRCVADLSHVLSGSMERARSAGCRKGSYMNMRRRAERFYIRLRTEAAVSA